MDLGIPLVFALVLVQIVSPHLPREHLQDLGEGGEGGGMTGNRTAIVQEGHPSNTTSHLAKLGKDGSGMIWPDLEDTAAASKFCQSKSGRARTQ